MGFLSAPTQMIGLFDLAGTHSLRCDARYFAKVYRDAEARMRSGPSTLLGEWLPKPFVKGVQPTYLDVAEEGAVPVINTLSVRNLSVNVDQCRYMARVDFEELAATKRLVAGDVLLTVDGGVSIGKAAVLEAKGDFTVDSHVCILRDAQLSQKELLYLLASPLAQLQFRRAESGASGQTTVTEDDIRRFMFPTDYLNKLRAIVSDLEEERAKIKNERECLAKREAAMWERLAAIDKILE